jgi:hypothetical protein
MDHAPTRPSLRTRITEAQPRATYSVDRSHFAPRRQESFVERYRGTEFESPTTVVAVREPLMSRGRSFVLIVGAAAIGVTGVLLAAAPG